MQRSTIVIRSALFATVLAGYDAEGGSDADFRAQIREIIDAPD